MDSKYQFLSAGARQSQCVPHAGTDTLVTIESPLPGERLLFKSVPIMVRSGAEGPVEVSIDAGPWRVCRHWMGYWWLRWENSRPGKHHVVARLRMARAEFARSSMRWFKVVPTLAFPEICGRHPLAQAPRQSSRGL